jgi:cytoskeleton protein RodZ
VPSIGETLREARMRQRLDIADVEARTKIRAKYLRALENEEFGMLPGDTFVKTFLRTYAEVLGVDPHVLIEEYRTNYEAPSELDVQPIGRPARGGGHRERRLPSVPPPGRGMAVVLGIVVVLAFLLVLGLTSSDDDGGGEGERASGGAETERQRPQRRRPKPRPTPRAVTLEVTPNGPVYVCLDRGPGTELLFEGTIDGERTFKGQKLRINLGRTAVEMKVNGKAFPVDPVGTPVGYEFSPTGSKSLPIGQRPCAQS